MSPANTTQPLSGFRIAIAGASGLLGTALGTRLTHGGAIVRRLRRAAAVAAPDIAWLPDSNFLDAKKLEGLDAIVNLAGERIDRRWTPGRKRAIRESRVKSTSLLARSIAELRRPPRMFLSGSAIGIYGDRGDEVLDEASAPGTGFLASTVIDWEQAAGAARREGSRVVLLRSGVVLSPAGGALARILPPFTLGLGGPMGSGRQWMSWIGLSDWLSAVLFLLTSNPLDGQVNLVAPEPVPNVEFTRTLARMLRRPGLLRLPAWMIGLLFGEMGRTTLLGSQRVLPTRLTSAGFEFATPELEEALRAELAGKKS